MTFPIFFLLVYLGVPCLLLVLFARRQPKLAPLTLILCPLLDLLVYHREFFYYESRGLVLLFTVVQVVLFAIPAYIIRKKSKSKEATP